MRDEDVNFWRRIVRSILYSRFEPLETIISLYMIFLGAGMILPFPVATFEVQWIKEGLTPLLATVLAWTYIALGATHLLGLARALDSVPQIYRRWSAFGSTVAIFFLSGLAFTEIGFWSVTWLNLLVVGLVSGVTYLSLSLGE